MEDVLLGIISGRLSHKRQNYQNFLSDFSLQMAGCFAICKYTEIPRLVNCMESYMTDLLADCDIGQFPEIGKEKAMDALNELSNYACIFAPFAETTEWYTKIVLLMDDIKSAYPLGAR